MKASISGPSEGIRLKITMVRREPRCSFPAFDAIPVLLRPAKSGIRNSGQRPLSHSWTESSRIRRRNLRGTPALRVVPDALVAGIRIGARSAALENLPTDGSEDQSRVQRVQQCTTCPRARSAMLGAGTCRTRVGADQTEGCLRLAQGHMGNDGCRRQGRFRRSGVGPCRDPFASGCVVCSVHRQRCEIR